MKKKQAFDVIVKSKLKKYKEIVSKHQIKK